MHVCTYLTGTKYQFEIRVAGKGAEEAIDVCGFMLQVSVHEDNDIGFLANRFFCACF